MGLPRQQLSKGMPPWNEGKAVCLQIQIRDSFTDRRGGCVQPEHPSSAGSRLNHLKIVLSLPCSHQLSDIRILQ